MMIVIVGPTGVGKTKLSIELAKKYHAEIINADSMQVYKGLNIGTAKVTESEKENIPHHLLDICGVEELYTVYNYQQDCRQKIEQLEQQHKNIIIVGGTGLYIKAALYDYRFKKEAKLNEYLELSNEEISNRIKQYEPNHNVHINNRKRLVRLLNKYEQNLITEKTGNHPLYSFKMIGLTTDRKNLYDRIDIRVDKMIEDGLIMEVKALYDRNIHSKAIQTGIGYKELYDYFDGTLDLQEAINNIKANSRHYAKRQYTFFKNQFPNIKWFETNYLNFDETVNEVICYIEGD